MSLKSIFSGTRATKPVVLFDISSGSVGALLCTLEADESPTIAYSVRLPIEFKRSPTFEELATAMLRVLEAVLTDIAHHSGSFSPKEAHCVFSSSWYSAHMKTLASKHKKPFSISRHAIERMLQEYEERLRQDTAKGNAEVADDLMLLEESVIHTTLNGYPTSSPMGKHASKLALHLYISFISQALVERIARRIEDSIGVSSVIPHSFLLSFFSTVRDIFKEEQDFLLVDVGGEVADFSLVRDGVLLNTTMIPWGRNTVLRTIAERLGTIPEEAHSLLRMRSEQSLEEHSDNKAAVVLKEIGEKWLGTFADINEQLVQGERLPEKTFLVSFPDTSKWFAALLSDDRCRNYTFTRRPFSVDTLSGKRLSECISVRKGAVYDPYMGLEAVFLNRVVGL